MNEVSNRALFFMLVFAIVVVVVSAFLIFNAAGKIDYSPGGNGDDNQLVSSTVGYVTIMVPEIDEGDIYNEES